jgi:putative flippase GtrA
MVYVALVLGILTGMVSNYLLSSKWVFRQEWGFSTFPVLSGINQAAYSHHSSSFLILSFTELSINRVRSALGFFVYSLPFFSLICVFLKFATSYKYELGLIQWCLVMVYAHLMTWWIL